MKIRGIKICKNNNNNKFILMYDNEGNFICKESATCIQKHSIEKFGTFLDRHRISDVCKGILPNYKGYIFKYDD